MVIYGIITEQSIARLLIAGIVPGIVITLIYMATVYIKVRLDPSLCPRIERASWTESVISLKDVWGIALLSGVIMGGIYSGWFTPTEAGAVGAFAAFALALVMKRVKRSELRRVLLEAARTTGMIYFVVASAFVFTSFLALTRLHDHISASLTTLDVNRYVILLGIVLFYVVMGCFIDVLPGAILTLPILYPAVFKLGFDPIWFGVLTVYLMELGMVTPPFGINLFVLKGIVEGSTLSEIIRGATPFIIAGVLILTLIIAFPQLSLWLPSMMR